MERKPCSCSASWFVPSLPILVLLLKDEPPWHPSKELHRLLKGLRCAQEDLFLILKWVQGLESGEEAAACTMGVSVGSCPLSLPSTAVQRSVALNVP